MIKLNKKSNFFLILTVVVIWGVIGFKVFNYLTAGDDAGIIENSETEFDVNISESEEKSINEADNVSYINLKRDPFLFKKKRNSKPKKRETPEEKSIIANDIDFVINGVIMKEDRKLVILQDRTNNSTMFLREGEKYKNLKINSISPSVVSLFQNNKEKKITLE